MIEIVKNVISDIQPEVIVLDGDVIDFYQISRFISSDERISTIQNDIDQATDFMSDIKRLAPRSRFIFIPGNHEDRLWKYIATESAALSNLSALKLENLLQLKALGFEFYNSKKNVLLLNDLNIIHGYIVRKHAGYSAKAMLDDLGMSCMQGHTHRVGIVGKTLGDRTIYGYEIGHCSDVSKLDYARKGQNWQNGFAIVTLANNTHYCNLVTVNNNKAFIHGNEYGGLDA